MVEPVQHRPRFYNVTQPPGRIRVANIQIPRGLGVYVARGWDHPVRSGLKITALDPSAAAFPGLRGQMIARGFLYDRESGERVIVQPIPLGHYIKHDRLDHVQATVEIIPTPGKRAGAKPTLTVIERKMDTSGDQVDRSKFIYTLTDDGTRELKDNIIKLQWVRAVEIRSDRQVDIKYSTADAPEQVKTYTLPANCFRDNFGQTMLGNASAEMSELGDLYQSPFYTTETERFRPQLIEQEGQLRLIVHKVKRYEIPWPAELNAWKDEAVDIKLFPTSVDGAAEIETAGPEAGRIWLPLTLDPLDQSLAYIQQHADLQLSQCLEGIIQSAIGPQYRFGEPNNISSEYPRDPYFYGLMVLTLFTTLEKWGEEFAINRAKCLRAFRGIESGRTHTMPWRLLYNDFADVIATNNTFLGKLSNFGEEFWGPGVSEDTQLEMVCWLRGVKMWVVKEMVALMPAEKEFSKYNTQNANRYNYSEALFYLSFLLSAIDSYEARFKCQSPAMMKLPEMSEIAAGRTWYKQAFAELFKNLSIPTFLASLGHILWYPVDLLYFQIAWLLRTVFASVNYTRHLVSLGYGFVTGFWKNPAMELMFFAGYLKGALEQFLYRPQYGTFALTTASGGGTVPNYYKHWLNGLAGITALSIAGAATCLVLGGAAIWLALPLGLAAVPLGAGLMAKAATSQRMGKITPHRPRWVNLALTVARYAGLAMAIGGAVTALATMVLVVWPAPISLSIIANLTFGVYSFALLVKGRLELRRAEKEQDILNNRISRKDVVKIFGKKDKSWEPLFEKPGDKMLPLKKDTIDKSNLPPEKKAALIALVAKAERTNGKTEIEVADKTTLADIGSKLRDPAQPLTLAELQQARVQVRTILQKYNLMDKKGKTIQGVGHPYRYAGFEILNTLAELEMEVTLTAMRELQLCGKNVCDSVANILQGHDQASIDGITDRIINACLRGANGQIDGKRLVSAEIALHGFRDAANQPLSTDEKNNIMGMLRARAESNRSAIRSIKTILRESREYLVIDTAAKMYRRLNLNLREE